MSRRRVAGAPALLLTVVLAAAVAGCAEDDDPGQLPAAAEPWNPCDGLSARAVSQALGQQLRKDTGAAADPAPSDPTASDPTATDPAVAARCALVPVREGDATFDASYLLFDGGLDAAWATLGDEAALGGRVTRPRVPGAEAARLVVNTTRKAALVTGFVETGDLIQTVNAADLAPYDGDALVRAVRLVLEQLAAHASAAGVE